MVWRSRVFVLVGCLAASACVGGPTSEWPKGADSDDGDEGTSGPGPMDAGKKPSQSIDAGVPSRPADNGTDCHGNSDAGIPLDAAAAPRTDASLPDAGCR